MSGRLYPWSDTIRAMSDSLLTSLISEQLGSVVFVGDYL